MKLMKRVFENGQYVDVPVTDDDVVMKVRNVTFGIQRTSDTLTVNLTITHRMGEPVPDESAILIVNGEEHTVSLTDGVGTYTQTCTAFDAFTLECKGQIEEVAPVTVITPEDRIAALEALVAQLMAGDA
jgi:DNA-binding beta-propeller fold protein YncE